MEKSNILNTLQERVQEQQLMQRVPFMRVFYFMSQLLGENPWRVIVPFAFLLTIYFQITFGKTFDETILNLFGAI